MTPDHGARRSGRRPGADEGPNPALVAALQAHDEGVGGPADVHSALAASRLLVPVVEPADGRSSHLVSATVNDESGRPAMLAFTSADALRRWEAHARFVPVPTRSAAEAALANGAASLVIDLAGPVTFAVDAPGLRSLAAGWREHGAWPAAGSVPRPETSPTDAVDEPAGEGRDVEDEDVGTSQDERGNDRDEPGDGRPDGTDPVSAVAHGVRDVVVGRIVPSAVSVVSRVWGVVHRRLTRTGN